MIVFPFWYLYIYNKNYYQLKYSNSYPKIAHPLVKIILTLYQILYLRAGKKKKQVSETLVIDVGALSLSLFLSL